MQDTLNKPASRRAFMGEDAPAPSALSPIVDKVGVPLLWMGIGYLLAKLTGKSKAV